MVFSLLFHQRENTTLANDLTGSHKSCTGHNKYVGCVSNRWKKKNTVLNCGGGGRRRHVVSTVTVGNFS